MLSQAKLEVLRACLTIAFRSWRHTSFIARQICYLPMQTSQSFRCFREEILTRWKHFSPRYFAFFRHWRTTSCFVLLSSSSPPQARWTPVCRGMESCTMSCFHWTPGQYTPQVKQFGYTCRCCTAFSTMLVVPRGNPPRLTEIRCELNTYQLAIQKALGARDGFLSIWIKMSLKNIHATLLPVWLLNLHLRLIMQKGG